MKQAHKIAKGLGLILLSLTLLNGCSVIDIDYTVPAQSFAPPETTGGKLVTGMRRARLNVYAGTAYKINVAEAHDAVYFIDLTPGKVHIDEGIKYATGLGSTAELALIKSIDLSVKKILDSLWSAGGKWQFIGATDQGPTRGLKASISAYYGGQLEIESDKLKSNARGGREYQSNLRLQGHEGILHLGYRLNERWLPYLNLRYAKISARGKLESNQFSDYNFAQSVENIGAFLGLQIDSKNEKFYYLIESGHSKIRLKGLWLHKRDDFRAGLSLGFNFF